MATKFLDAEFPCVAEKTCLGALIGCFIAISLFSIVYYPTLVFPLLSFQSPFDAVQTLRLTMMNMVGLVLYSLIIALFLGLAGALPGFLVGRFGFGNGLIGARIAGICVYSGSGISIVIASYSTSTTRSLLHIWTDTAFITGLLLLIGGAMLGGSIGAFGVRRLWRRCKASIALVNSGT